MSCNITVQYSLRQIPSAYSMLTECRTQRPSYYWIIWYHYFGNRLLFSFVQHPIQRAVYCNFTWATTIRALGHSLPFNQHVGTILMNVQLKTIAGLSPVISSITLILSWKRLPRHLDKDIFFDIYQSVRKFLLCLHTHFCASMSPYLESETEIVFFQHYISLISLPFPILQLLTPKIIDHEHSTI